MRSNVPRNWKGRMLVVAFVCVIAGCSGSDGERLAELVQQLIKAFAAAAGVCLATGLAGVILAMRAPRPASAGARGWGKAALIVACAAVVMAGCGAGVLLNWDRLEESHANKAVEILLIAGFVIFLLSLPAGFAAWAITALVIMATAARGEGTRRQWLMLALGAALSAAPATAWALLLLKFAW